MCMAYWSIGLPRNDEGIWDRALDMEADAENMGVPAMRDNECMATKTPDAGMYGTYWGKSI